MYVYMTFTRVKRYIGIVQIRSKRVDHGTKVEHHQNGMFVYMAIDIRNSMHSVHIDHKTSVCETITVAN